MSSLFWVLFWTCLASGPRKWQLRCAGGNRSSEMCVSHTGVSSESLQGKMSNWTGLWASKCVIPKLERNLIELWHYYSRHPSWCGSADWGPTCGSRGRWFGSQSGHMPGMWARTPSWACAGSNLLMFLVHISVSLPLFLPSFPSF